jgi:hypothetical protein
MALEVLLGGRWVLCFRVVIKTIAIHKSLTAHITFKWSLPCMYIFMLLQEISGIKSFTTNVTLNYVLTKMSFLVYLQISFIVSTITTNITDKILLLSMNISLMFTDLALAFEGFLTYVTNKRPLLAVISRMAPQLAAGHEHFFTFTALKYCGWGHSFYKRLLLTSDSTHYCLRRGSNLTPCFVPKAYVTCIQMPNISVVCSSTSNVLTTGIL